MPGEVDKIDSYIDRTGFGGDTEFGLQEINKMYKALVNLNNIKVDLGKALGLGDTISVATKAKDELTKVSDAQIKLAESSKKAADAARTEAAGQNELSQALAKNQLAQKQITDAKKALNAEFKSGAIDQDTYIKKIAQLNDAQNALKISAADMQRAIKNIEKESQTATGSLDQLRAQLNLATQAFDKLSAEERESDTGQALKAKVNSLLEAVSKEEQATGRFQRNVGNYANSLSGAFSKISDEISNIQKKNEGIQSQFQNLTGSRTVVRGLHDRSDFNDDTKAQIASLTKEYEKNQVALQQLQATQELGFKVGANQTQQVRQLEQAYIAFATSGTQSIEFLEAFKNQVGSVKDDVNDLKESINLAASDTKHLDVFIGTAQALAGGFGILQGSEALLGNSSEDLQKQLVKLNAVMTVLNGLQAIQAELKKKDNIITIAQTAIQKTYTAVVGASTGAVKAFRIALASTVVGALLVGLGLLISKLIDFASSTKDAKIDVESLTEALDKQKESFDRLNEVIDLQGKIRRERLKQQGVDQKKIFEDEQNDRKKQLENLIKIEQGAAEARDKFIDENNKRREKKQKEADAKLSQTDRDLGFKGVVEISKEDQDAFDSGLKELNKRFEEAQNARINAAINNQLAEEQQKTKVIEDANKKRDDLNKKALEKNKEQAERNARAIFELQKLDLEVDARNQQKIIENDKATGKEKLTALIQYTQDKQQIIELSADFEKKTGKKTAKEIELIEKKKLDEITILYEEFTTKRDEILSRPFDPQLIQKTESSLTESIQKFFEAESEARKQLQEQKKQYAAEERALYKNLYDELTQTVTDFFNVRDEKELASIQRKIDLVEEEKAKELDAINATTKSAEEKAALVSLAESKASAQKEQLAAKQREIEKKQRSTERLGQIAQATGNLINGVLELQIKAAEARAQAALLASNPITAPYAAVALAQSAFIQSQIPIVSAIGLAQLARLALPKFKTGKNLDKVQSYDDYEGLAWVGDGGKHELHISEGKATVTPDTPTLTNVKKNDIILPDVNMLTDRVIARTLSKEYSVNVHGELDIKENINDLKNEFRSTGSKIVNAIKNKKEIHFDRPSVMDRVQRFKDGNKEYFKMNGL